MDDLRADRSTPGPGAADPRGNGGGEPAGTASRRPAVVLIVVLGALIAAATVGYLFVTGGLGSTAPGADLEGTWSGTGTVAACEGQICAPSQEIELSVECSWSTCEVGVFGVDAELAEDGDRVTASGSIPPQHLRSCTGGGFVTGQWSLELEPDGDTLVGRYTEQTTSSCGPVVSRTVESTESAWDLELSRS